MDKGHLGSGLVISAQGISNTRRGAIRPGSGSSSRRSNSSTNFTGSNNGSRPQSATHLMATQKRVYEYSAKKFPTEEGNYETNQDNNGEHQYDALEEESGSGIQKKRAGHQKSAPTPMVETNGTQKKRSSKQSSRASTPTSERGKEDEEKILQTSQLQQAQNKDSLAKRVQHVLEKNGTTNVTTNEVPTPKDDEVIIHVYDETNKINRDFVCKRDLLLREMKYFRAYLTENCSFDDIDISVHCDVNIFQWLMDYIKNPLKPPKLDTSWAISILISSDFLEMDKLVKTTLKFVKDRLNQIIKLPIELDCINNKLVTHLAKLFKAEELDAIRDKRNKIISRLYMKKIEEMFHNEEKALCKCKNCSKVYCVKQHDWQLCLKANSFIDFNGDLTAQHTIDSEWNINMYLVALRKGNLTWKQIYWHMWGLTHHFYCSRSKMYFSANELNHCSYHEKEPIFDTDTNVGVYPCCKQKTLRFDSARVMIMGCMPRKYAAMTNEHTSSEADLDILVNKSKLICTPYGEKPYSTSDIDMFDGNSEVTIINDSDSEASDSEAETAERFRKQGNHAGGKLHKYEIYHAYSRNYRVDGTLPETILPQRVDRKIKKKFSSNHKMTATRKRFYFLDKQRDSDIDNMRQLVSSLSKARKSHSRKEKRRDKKKSRKSRSSSKSKK